MIRKDICADSERAAPLCDFVRSRLLPSLGIKPLAVGRPSGMDMNIAEAAKYLFVSRPHVRLLLERGKIAGTPTDDGDYAIDEASVEKYAADRKLAAKVWLDSHTEDAEPPGL